MTYSKIFVDTFFRNSPKGLLFPLFAWLLATSLWQPLQAQETGEDSTFFVQQVQDLINQRQYASAHVLLEDRLQQEGLKPFYLCWMVENGLQHYFRQENYRIFYLKDENNHWNRNFLDTLQNVRIARLRYPERLLQTTIHQHPRYARAYKLLGDYYDLQVQDISDFEFPDNQKMEQLESLIFKNYSMAEHLGYQDVDVNRWLGEYYLRHNQPEKAEKFFLKNTGDSGNDPISYLHLAEISFQRKEYTQSYNYAIQALKYFSPEDVYLKYDAMRLAAKSLLAMGETGKFLKYTRECIQVLPDVQDAYIDLVNFYERQNNTENAEKILKEMLLNNPYDRKGYDRLEKFAVKYQDFYFADKLFDEMLVRFENWDEVMANIYWSKGNLAFYRGLPSEAEKFWEISRNYMRRYLPEDSPIIKQVGSIASKTIHRVEQ